jgi:hypothetical protein
MFDHWRAGDFFSTPRPSKMLPGLVVSIAVSGQGANR